MTWEKLVERKGDFLKNYLLHESFEEFPKVFNLPHCDFLTVRTGNTFTHYLEAEGAAQLCTFVANQGPEFHEKVKQEGTVLFEELVAFGKELHAEDLSQSSRRELADLAEVYFRKYKAPYPYFHIAVLGQRLDLGPAVKLAQFRLFGRTSFNRTHGLVEPFFDEIAARLGLLPSQAKFLTPMEIVDGLVGHMLRVERRQECFFLHQRGKFSLREGESFVLPEEIASDVRGTGTFSARVTGPVRIVRTREDMVNVQRGEIVVTRMTTPDIITNQLRRAAAIVTDEGGATCHAAIISRELGIPALLGTKNATSLLKNGDVVTVNTKNGRVTPS